MRPRPGEVLGVSRRALRQRPKAGPEQLKAYAQQAGLDLPSFERCLASGTHAAAVQKSVDEAIRLGVTGRPAFFVNGAAHGSSATRGPHAGHRAISPSFTSFFLGRPGAPWA